MDPSSARIEDYGLVLPPELLRLFNGVEDIKVVREPHLAEKVVIVDGFPGCGKTMMSPIVGALPRVEIMQYAYTLEYLCALRYLGRIEEDAANVVIRMLTDLQLYNVMMGRETNFRRSDLSGVLSNPRPLRYFKRLFKAGDAAVIDRVRAERPILNLTMHNVSGFSAPIYQALGSRVLIVHVVRHPLYMIRQQALYSDRYGTDIRDFSICFSHNGVSVPWFSLGWEDRFLRSTPVEKSIYMIYYLTRRIEEMVEAGDGSGSSLMVVSFEQYVIDPWPFMHRLETLLETKMDSQTRKTMKKQRVPRKMYAEGIGLKIYRDNAWHPPRKGADERSELDERRDFAAANASSEAMEILDQLSARYEEKYL